MPRVLLAPDKFKGTLTAAEVAAHLARGIRARRPDADIDTAAVADGGDGLLAACESAGFARVSVMATGPTGAQVSSAYVRRGDAAVIELAAVAGLAQLGADRAPMTATSRGVGEVIAAALDAGCAHIVLGIGGSASTDGGAGMVQALGVRVLDAHGRHIADGGGVLGEGTRLDQSLLHPRLADARIDIACDVDNPLTGPRGAAAVYGPQKGADESQVHALDGALTHWADVVAAATGRDHRADPGAGAAGGVGFAAVALLGGTLRPGVQFVLETIDFPGQLHGADLVVTGEGSLDEQTLNGKAPAGVAAAAREVGVPVVVVAGRCTLDDVQLKTAGFDAVYTLLNEADDADDAFHKPGPLLHGIGEKIADRLD